MSPQGSIYLDTNALLSHALDKAVRVCAISLPYFEVCGGCSDGKRVRAKVLHASFSTKALRLLEVDARLESECAVGRYAVMWSSNSGGRSVRVVDCLSSCTVMLVTAVHKTCAEQEIYRSKTFTSFFKVHHITSAVQSA